MNKILILYPKLFNSYSKFQRKVENIISNLGEVTLVYRSDPNFFINKLSEENKSIIGVLESNDCSDNDITHVIIFDDGEEFPNEIKFFKLNGIPLRYIKIAITRVVNISDEIKYQAEKSTSSYEYIGRRSYWGNPYSMYEEGDGRDEVIRKFKYDFDYEKFPKKEKLRVYGLAGKRLGCFCKPQACHGDV